MEPARHPYGVVSSPLVDPPRSPKPIELMLPEATVTLLDALWLAILRVMRNGAMTYLLQSSDNHISVLQRIKKPKVAQTCILRKIGNTMPKRGLPVANNPMSSAYVTE